MIVGLSKGIQCSVFLLANHQIRHPATSKMAYMADNMVIANGHFYLLHGFVWVINGLTYSLYQPEGQKYIQCS